MNGSVIKVTGPIVTVIVIIKAFVTGWHLMVSNRLIMILVVTRVLPRVLVMKRTTISGPSIVSYRVPGVSTLRCPVSVGMVIVSTVIVSTVYRWNVTIV